MNQDRVMESRRAGAQARLPRLRVSLAKYEAKLDAAPDNPQADVWRRKVDECRAAIVEIKAKGYQGSDAPVGVMIGAPRDEVR